MEAYSPITHGEILNQPQIKAMADKYGVTVPQLCIRYVLQSGLIALPKTANPVHMQSNGEVDFEISPEDMETLKHFKRLKIMEQAVASQCMVVKSDQTGVDKLV